MIRLCPRPDASGTRGVWPVTWRESVPRHHAASVRLEYAFGGVALMSSADASKAQTFFQYGNEAALKSNFDYAIEMYQRACKLAPENLLYRQALRGTERKKFQNDPSKVGRLVGARLQPIRLKMRGPKSKQNWSQVLEICEEAFVLHPWDVTTAREAADAAEHLGHDLLAQWLLESVAA
ncbi:MAG: hypothetical protein JO329_22900, partial [Planctomycetaceae bacterium]|nr:hypothetical protein [Planctomycetaceae bacterium]